MTTTKMDPIKKQIWINALLSGHYQQGVGHLHVNDSFCCLGVLCDISRQGRWEESECIDDGFIFFSEDPSLEPTRYYLPDEIAKLYGFEANDPRVPVPEDYLQRGGKEGNISDGLIGLSFLNDAGYTFPEIARLIAQHL